MGVAGRYQRMPALYPALQVANAIPHSTEFLRLPGRTGCTALAGHRTGVSVQPTMRTGFPATVGQPPGRCLAATCHRVHRTTIAPLPHRTESVRRTLPCPRGDAVMTIGYRQPQPVKSLPGLPSRRDRTRGAREMTAYHRVMSIRSDHDIAVHGSAV